MSTKTVSRTTELVAKLRRMANEAGSALYERVCMAKDVLADNGWIAEVAEGDFGKAADLIEKDCFPEICTVLSIHDLLVLLKKFPERKQWQDAKWNLKLLWAEYEKSLIPDNGSGTKEPQQRANWKMVAQRDEEIKDLKFEIKRKNEKENEWDNERMQLKQKVEQLQLENARLKGRIEQLEAVVENMTSRRPVAV